MTEIKVLTSQLLINPQKIGDSCLKMEAIFQEKKVHCFYSPSYLPGIRYGRVPPLTLNEDTDWQLVNVVDPIFGRFSSEDALLIACQQIIDQKEHDDRHGLDFDLEEDNFLINSYVFQSETPISEQFHFYSQKGQLYALQKISNLATGIGFDWQTFEEVWQRIESELNELDEAFKTKNKKQIANEIGDIFFILFNLARRKKIDLNQLIPETNLRYQDFYLLYMITFGTKILDPSLSLDKSISQSSSVDYQRLKIRINDYLNKYSPLLASYHIAEEVIKLKPMMQDFNYLWQEFLQTLVTLKAACQSIALPKTAIEDQFANIIFLLIYIGYFFKLPINEIANVFIKKIRQRFYLMELTADKSLSSLDFQQLTVLWQNAKEK